MDIDCSEWEGSCLLEMVVRTCRDVSSPGRRRESSSRNCVIVADGSRAKTLLGRPLKPVTRTLTWDTAIVSDMISWGALMMFGISRGFSVLVWL